MTGVFAALVLLAAPPEQPVSFDEYFTAATMRVDYSHSGNVRSESFALVDLRRQEPWPGSRNHLVDTTGYGKYMLRVHDAATGRLIFSRGFASLFGEWQTTEEAKRVSRVFEETALLPYPKSGVRLVIASRDKRNRFHDVWSLDVDPTSYLVRRERPFSGTAVTDIHVQGDPATQLDVTILAEGYTAGESPKFRADASRFARALLSTPPFKDRAANISIRAVEAVSAESGTDEPRKGFYRDTALDCTFNTFETERYLTTGSIWKVQDYAALAPTDTFVVVVNTSRYGGAGIFNHFSIGVSDNEYDDYVFVHEFGHGFAGLGDEYYSSGVADSEFYPKGVEPWEPNITALLDHKHAKWGRLIKPGTPVPTPPDRGLYSPGDAGVFEGAGYAAKGLYRPAIDCKMFSKALRPFDPVCSDTISRMIDMYAE